MNRRILIILFLLPSMVYSQNWRNICSEGKTFFADTSMKMAAFRLDSAIAAADRDTIYFSYLVLRGDSGNCLDSLHGSVMGEKIIGKADGRFCFFNKTGDSLWINTGAGLNVSWDFYHPQAGNLITAKVFDIRTDTIMGIIDSVKYISLKDNAGTVDGVIKLSKHFGLSQLPDLYYIPEIRAHYTLAGKSAVNLGFEQCLQAKDIYNFAAGDEFHYYHRKDIAYPRHFDTTEIRKVLAVSWAADSGSVTYKFRRCMRVQHVWEYPVDTSYTDTVDWQYNFSSSQDSIFLLKLPGEKDGVWLHQFLYRQYNSRTVSFSRYGEFWYYPIDSCWKSGGGGGVLVPGNYYFAPGLGMTGFTSEGHSTGELLELKYYRKGSEAWGNPVVVECSGTGVDERAGMAGARVLPNPADGCFSLSVAGKSGNEIYRYAILDPLGRPVISGSFRGNSVTLERNGLPSGLYIILINDSRGKSSPAVKVLLK